MPANQPTRASVRHELAAMVSGECRYIVEPRVQVYCHAPMVERPCPVTGRMIWNRGPRWYRVECPGLYESTPEQLFDKTGNGRWLKEDETVDRVLRALASPAAAPRPPIPYGSGRTHWERMRDLYPVAGAPRPQPTRDDEEPATVLFPPAPANQPTQRRLFA